MSQMRGDLPFIHMVFRWQTFLHKAFTCHRCLASKVLWNLLFTNVRENAGWRNTMIRHAHYMRNTTRETRSKLCECLGWHMQIVFHDEMHGVNLGPQSYFNGTCLHELSEEMVEDASRVGEQVNQGDALKQIWLDFKVWRNRHKIPCSIPQFTKATSARKQ